MDKITSAKDIGEIYWLNIVLGQAAHALHKTREIDLDKFGITVEQSGALICILSLGKDATVAELSRWQIREPHSTLVLVRRMAKQQLIDINPDSTNKHILKLTLTQKGFSILKDTLKLESLVQIYSRIPKKELQHLHSLLDILRDTSYDFLGLKAQSRDNFGKAFSSIISENNMT